MTTARRLRRAAKKITKEKNVSNRRKIPPAQVARQDQVLAEARDYARVPRSAAVVILPADDDLQCSWCDCDDDAATHDREGSACDGCTHPAVHIMHLLYGTPEQANIAVCDSHKADLVRCASNFIKSIAAPGAQIEFRGV